MRHDAGAIEDALTQLQNNLCRSQVIAESHQLDRPLWAATSMGS
jgi:hypothetical protein